MLLHANLLIGTVISGFLAVFRRNSDFSPNYNHFSSPRNSGFLRTTTIFPARTTEPIKNFRQRQQLALLFSLFLLSIPDSHQFDKTLKYISHGSLYKHRFRGVILFCINFVFGYYTDTSASSGGERAQTVSGCSRFC